jgi:molybdopterin synthase catalytic subunit
MKDAALIADPIVTAHLLEEVSDDTNGAGVLFVGKVRNINDGRAVDGLEYSAYAEMAEREMDAIIDEAKSRFGVPNVRVVHRIGSLNIGDVSVAVAVGSPHRGAAFDAARYIMDELKQRVPIWKREHYTDGSAGWVDGAVHS